MAYSWNRTERWALRILCAVALVFVGLAHRVPASAQTAENPAAYADYLLPDGSLASLCLTATSDDGAKKGDQDHRRHADQGCEACRISAASLLPSPAGVIDSLFRTDPLAVQPLRPQAVPRRHPPPNTGPRAPPLPLTTI